MGERTKRTLWMQLARLVEGVVTYAVGQYVFLSLDFPMALVGAAIMVLGVWKVATND